MTNPPDQNTQHGVPIGDGIRDSDDRIATGDRREAVHYEPDERGGVRVAHLKRPDGPLPPQMDTVDGPGASDGQPVQDVKVAPEGPSVWDARPADEGHEHPGKR